jgi:hypothetical protein
MIGYVQGIRIHLIVAMIDNNAIDWTIWIDIPLTS